MSFGTTRIRTACGKTRKTWQSPDKTGRFLLKSFEGTSPNETRGLDCCKYRETPELCMKCAILTRLFVFCLEYQREINMFDHGRKKLSHVPNAHIVPGRACLNNKFYDGVTQCVVRKESLLKKERGSYFLIEWSTPLTEWSWNQLNSFWDCYRVQKWKIILPHLAWLLRSGFLGFLLAILGDLEQF